MADVKVDISALEELRHELDQMGAIAIGRLANAAFNFLRADIKKSAYITGNLQQGVASPAIGKSGKQVTVSENTFGKTDVNYQTKTATLTVSARSARRGAKQATLHLKSGETRKITLRATKAYNYAEAVALGRPAIRAKSAKVLLIPVPPGPVQESYITVDGQMYIMRKSAKATKANPFHERAAKRLESEAQGIVDAIIEEFR